MVTGREIGQITVANVGYARVSTIGQNPALQLDALAAAGCAKVFEDRASGARADRAGLRSALDHVRDGDVLIVWKLDRLGRSLPHLIETVTTLEKRGVGFRSITEAIDTTTPGGPACVSPVRRTGAVRTRPDTGTDTCRPRSSRGAGPQRWAQARRHQREARTRASHHRQGFDRARGCNPPQSGENGAL